MDINPGQKPGAPTPRCYKCGTKVRDGRMNMAGKPSCAKHAAVETMIVGSAAAGGSFGGGLLNTMMLRDGPVRRFFARRARKRYDAKPKDSD